jgi:GNAT superfamily N-acetyltransferase
VLDEESEELELASSRLYVMASTPDGITLVRYEAAAVPLLLDGICAVYADAYGKIPGENSTVKVAAFRERATKALTRPGYELVTAHEGDELAGFVFGYALSSDTHWWDDLTPQPSPDFLREDGTRTFVVAEIEVGKQWQGSGVGRALHDAVLNDRREGRATLATGPGADTARAIYEGWGWQKVGVVPGTPGDYFSEYTLYVLPLPLPSR